MINLNCEETNYICKHILCGKDFLLNEIIENKTIQDDVNENIQEVENNFENLIESSEKDLENNNQIKNGEKIMEEIEFIDITNKFNEVKNQELIKKFKNFDNIADNIEDDDEF
jgi:uncharacterized coiled-coil DUF342 family protein